MENLTFMSSVVPLGPIMVLISRTFWWGICLVVSYYMGHYLMGGLRALWRRR